MNKVQPESPRRGKALLVLLGSLLIAAGGATAQPASPPSTRPATQPVVGLYGGLQLEGVEESGIDIVFPSIHWFDDDGKLAATVAAAHKIGVKVMPSLAMAHDGSATISYDFARNNPQFYERLRNGKPMDGAPRTHLSWGHPEVRRYKVEAVTQIARESGCDGVLLDYIRYFGTDTGYSDVLVDGFQKEFGRDPRKIAEDDPDWVRYRARFVTEFIKDLRASLQALPKPCPIYVCVRADPEAAARDVMCDWGGWLDAGLIDGVVTMIYERDTNHTVQRVRSARQFVRDRVPFYPMIACWGGNLDTPEMLKEGCAKVLREGVPGVAIYRSDAVKELKLWDTIREVAHWDLAEIRRDASGYVLNGGFENGLENWATGADEAVAATSDHARAGSQGLKVSLPGQRAVRQLIDRGIPVGARSVHLSAWIDAAKQQGAAAAWSVHVHYPDGAADEYAVPVKLNPSGGFQQHLATVGLREKTPSFVIVSLEFAGGEGGLYVDDVRAEFRTAPADLRQHRRQAPPQTAAGNASGNLALGQLVRASSFWANGYEAANAVDGDCSEGAMARGAAWHSQRPAKDQWLRIYLPGPKNISRIRLLNSSAAAAYRTRKYEIAVSMDDVNYKVVAEGTLPNDGTKWTELTIPPTQARFVRFTGVTGYNLDYAVGLTELELY